ncbi:hypothetical protein AQUCO_01300912v1 [Aquilegia coerulea]|uniref:KIB1-4 beta-propeller domain-containing protein n=1 Tax=Aquilegia coerulea TaxID=218851 RepID=A0A2G5E472_AQUCA|nr:hypothetical protein AQUCO_01300912v1 [Aquilegia coerulea]
MGNSIKLNWLDLPSHLQVSISNKLVHLNLYNLSQKKFNYIPIRVPLRASCRGSTEGWLVYEDGSQLHLVNPFLSPSKNKIHLPVLTAFDVEDSVESTVYKNIYFYKTVLSANPTLYPNYMVMTIDAGRLKLAFYKSGDSAWTHSAWTDLVGNENVGPMTYIEDIIYSRDCFYVLDCHGAVWAYDVSSHSPRVVKIAPPITEQWNIRKKYIVESSGDLLLVCRSTVQQWKPEDNKCSYKTVKIKVYKLDQVACKWTETNKLCGQTLFIGDNTSLSLLASD